VEIKFKEDLVLLPRWLRQVVEAHSVSMPFTVRTHVPLGSGEVDVVVEDRRKAIAIELKESDYVRVMLQAEKRTLFFDYVYAALNLHASTILSILRSYPNVLRSGVGFVSTRDDCIVIRAYRSRNVAESLRYKKILDFMRTDQEVTG